MRSRCRAHRGLAFEGEQLQRRGQHEQAREFFEKVALLSREVASELTWLRRRSGALAGETIQLFAIAEKWDPAIANPPNDDWRSLIAAIRSTAPTVADASNS